MKNKKLVGALVALLFIEALLTGFIPLTKGMLYDAFTAKAGIYFCIFIAFFNYFFLDTAQCLKGWMVNKVAMKARENRTGSVINGLTSTPPVDLSRNGHPVDNVPQRIQEDIKLSYISRITVWCEYSISAAITIQLLIINLHQPVLVAASLGYAMLSVVIAYLFNPRLKAAEVMVQKEEANFRESLANSLSPIGLPKAVSATIRAATIRLQYQLFTKLQLGLLNVLPYIVLTPLLVNGTITIGELVKHQSTFSLIVVNAAILIQYYTVLIQGKASESRVRDLEDYL